MKERIEYYDNARGILILLVVLGHILIKANPGWSIKPYSLACSWINSFHMPAFFLLSGMLFDCDRWRTSSWGAFLIKRLQTLVVPYLFFEIIGMLYLRFVLHSISLPEGLLRIVTLQCNVGADWFLPAMFFAGLLMFAYAKYLAGRKLWMYISIVFGTACFFTSWFIPNGIVGNTAIRSLMGFGFMLAGHFLKNHMGNVTAIKAALALVLSIAFAFLSYRFAHNDFYDAVVSIPPLFFASAVTGTYFVLGVASLIKWKPLTWLGENSLIIMGTHQLVLYTVKSQSSVLWVVGIMAMITAIEIILIQILNRFCPHFVGRPIIQEGRKKRI